MDFSGLCYHNDLYLQQFNKYNIFHIVMHTQANKHTVTESEKQSFAKHVNDVLHDDPDLKNKLPVSAKTIFDMLQDGIIFCKLINAAVPGKIPPISPEAINTHNITTYHKIQNLNLAISSAKSIGCMVINVRPEFIMEKRQHIVLGLVWQIIRIHLSNQITLIRHPEIIVLKKEDEDPQVMKKLGYEEILIRWFNYHIKKNGGTKFIKNLGNDLSDSQGFGHVLTNVAHLDKQFWDKDKNGRAAQVIQTCIKQNIQTKVKPEDIVNGNPRLNTILAVQIFNKMHGLHVQEAKIVELPPQQQTDQTRQIRIFKNWINSQGIEDVYVSYLMTDLRNGRILLKVIDNFKPGSVDWKKRYSDKLHSRIHIVQNCNYVIQLCKQLGVKLIGVDGVDIVDGKVTLTLGVVWQICKIYWEKRVGKLNDEQLVSWANSKVPNEYHIKNLKDPSIANCQFLLHLIESIKSKTVDFSKLKTGDSQADMISNINYTIASARKLGAQVITLWEHVKQSNPKYLGILIAELQHIQKNIK